ncbi:translation elongation factor Ts (EF-Ts) [Alkalispirillum mobile]|uniref:Elongation factor Ts n=1 Tax=Alkalispirillum mobile TaxID=85925 RepID=A0A498C4N9_9GAMM|nr:translation elongation factor Ts [Alkalispirillum mobile]RLK50725.1 translation elongation factor Ts (EF-Ts) [Alkalispirillum mobile]
MAISASLVKQLRERTGSGMMECKKALVETDGDLEAAVEHMRKKGLAKADKKSGRIAAEGIIASKRSDDGHSGVLVEINSETDFVAKGDDFLNFANGVAALALDEKPEDLDGLMACTLDGQDLAMATKELVAKIGENIQVRRFVRFGSSGNTVAQYLHGSRIGVMVELEGGDEQLARDVAMHIAASKPACVSEDDMPADVVEKEKAILVEQARESGKPEEIIEKMVQGRLKKFINEQTLVGQPFVKDPDQSVGDLLKAAGAKVVRFVRYEVGEGKEKKEENFAEEVMAQARGS